MKRFIIVAVAAMFLFGAPTVSKAVVLPPGDQYALTYGDFYSYSLPVLAYVYDQAYGGGTGPGNPYYIDSSPGQIGDYIVIATGTNNAGAVTNFAGMDDAYATPNNSPSGTTFSTAATADPDPTFANDQADTWDSTIQAFIDYLGVGKTPQFFFNNNDTGSAQDLRVYGTITLWSSTGGGDDIVFELISTPGDGSGVFGGDPYAYSFGDTPLTDDAYVLSGGQTCLDGSNQPVDCSDASAVATFNHNLGANQAAYVVVAPELDDFILAWDSQSAYDMLSIDLRLMDIDNGYEQAFVLSQLGRTVTHFPVPEPSTWMLLGIGLLMLPFLKKALS